jgi:propanol-preferring alcohol dehydrogenase
VRYREVGRGPEVCDVDVPEPGPGQVLVKVTAAGLCHSDVSLMSMPAGRMPYPLPLTLGHEGVGTVAATGRGVEGVALGDDVAIYLVWGCGSCRQCAHGRENYCLRRAPLGRVGPGLGWDGALAELVLVDDVRHLVPLGGLDPLHAVPLTDAGLTPYHAIKRAMPGLVPGSTAVVIGVGGLGHLAVQLLRATTPARVIALDVNRERLDLAERLGADETVLPDADAVATVRRLAGDGAQAVFDFVGTQQTLDLAARVVTVDGHISVVGMGSGAVPVGFGRLPFATTVSVPFAGARTDLVEVLDLARSGRVSTHVQVFSLEDAPRAYELLRAGNIEGRAVVVP